MQWIGLLGGVASGKSLVARQLADLGAGVLDADRAGHEVLRLPEIIEASRQKWGERVIGPDGQVDRAELAKVVFAATTDGVVQRKYLEKLTHPAIARALQAQADALAASGVEVVVLDAPLILEASWDKLCRRLVFVDAPQEARLARALARGWTEEEFAAREAAQHSLECKRERADVVIDNSGTPEHTRAQIERLWQDFVETD